MSQLNKQKKPTKAFRCFDMFVIKMQCYELQAD